MKILIRLLISLIFPVMGFGAVAANDLLLTQRNSDGTGNAQRNVTATANNILMFNSTLIPVSKTLAAGDNITITQNATTVTINSTGGGGGSGNVTSSGTPTSGQAAEFSTSTNIVGITVVGSGNYIKDTSPSFQGNVTLATGTAPTTAAAGALAFDTNAWASGRGAGQLFDGTANTNIVATLASDTPTDGQIPTWHTGGTITWDTASGTGNVTNSTTLDNNTVTLGDGSDVVKNSTMTYNGSNSTLTIGAAGAGNIIANVVTLQNLTVTDLFAVNLTLTNPVSGDAGGTGVQNTGKTITLGGNLTTSGAFATTLTSTAATSVTLPTTGTLATLAGSEALTNKTLNGLTVTAGTNAFALTNGTTTMNISGGFVGNIIVSGNVSSTLPEIAANIGFRGIPWVVSNSNATTNATSNGKGWIGDVIANNTTTYTINRTQAGTDAANGGWAWSVFHATAGGNVITVTASSGNIILAGSGNLTGGASAVIAAGGIATFTLANATLVVSGSNVTVP